MATDDLQRTRPGDDMPAWPERLVLFLDDGFVVPGTTFRVGFDAVLGLIPGVGDVVMTASSLSLLWLAHERGASRTVVSRMLLNIGLDALVGAVPIFGDIFDVVFKANRRNLELLRRHDRDRKIADRSNAGFLALVAFSVILMLTVPIVLAILIVRLLVG